MIRPFGSGTPMLLVSMGAMMLISGALFGANAAAVDEQPTDLGEKLHERTFTEDGEFKQREPPETAPGVESELVDRTDEFTPDTPHIDRWSRQHIAKPLILATIWMADVGSRIGYGMASTIGVGVTRVLLQGATVALIGGVVVRTVWLFRRAGR